MYRSQSKDTVISDFRICFSDSAGASRRFVSRNSGPSQTHEARLVGTASCGRSSMHLRLHTRAQQSIQRPGARKNSVLLCTGEARHRASVPRLVAYKVPMIFQWHVSGLMLTFCPQPRCSKLLAQLRLCRWCLELATAAPDCRIWCLSARHHTRADITSCHSSLRDACSPQGRCMNATCCWGKHATQCWSSMNSLSPKVE